MTGLERGRDAGSLEGRVQESGPSQQEKGRGGLAAELKGCHGHRERVLGSTKGRARTAGGVPVHCCCVTEHPTMDWLKTPLYRPWFWGALA